MLFAQLLGQKWNDEDLAKGPKPTAMGTPYRYSAAGSCSRQQAYNALGVQPSEPFDVASSWATHLGEIIHEQFQAAIGEKYPNAQFEVASQIDHLLSGSCDGILTLEDGTKVLIEIKTRGQYAWQKETGIGQWKRTEPEGPKWGAIAQAGMNALALGADVVVMISLAKESVSHNKRQKMGIADIHEAYAAEWWVPKEEFETYALEEVARVHSIQADLDARVLPEQEVVDDNGKRVIIKNGSHWACDYCQFKTICKADGDGPVQLSLTQHQGESRE